ncbi:MAG: hypothetical protein J5999_02400 [Oscillospiraceae bacterium]|nr:hypothetical protein [Oscillospiraceae bacterium]
MKMSKILAAAAAGAMAVSMMAAMPASAEGTYHAYLGIQSASFTFRNAWYEPSYGQGVAADDGTNYFDHLTGWDGPTATNNGGTFTDAEITGDGTYSVSLTGDFNFGSDETLNLLFVSTDIPLDSGVTISDVKVKIDGSTKYTFDEAYLSPDATEYLEPMAINIWNDDLGKADGLFGYTMPTSSVEVEFTVSGMAAAAPAEETTEAAPAEDATEAPAADTTETTAPATGNASAAAIAAVMAVAGAAAVISKKRR